MNWADIFQANSLVWPLVGLLVALLILKQIKDDVRPIFLAMVSPLAKEAQSNAVAWMNGILLAVLSMLGELNEVATEQHWVWVGIVCKVSGPPIATVVALINRKAGPTVTTTAPPGSTAPPFPPATPATGEQKP